MNRSIYRGGFALLCLAALAAPSLSQVKKVGQAYQLRSLYKKGQVIKMAMAIEMTTPQKMNVTSLMTQRVLDVKNGIATIETTTSQPKAAGQPVSSDVQIPKVITKVNSRNKPVEGELQSLNSAFPEKPIKIGETWTGEFPLGPVAGSDAVGKASYKLVSVDAKVATLQVTINVAGQMEVKGMGTIKFDVADGVQRSADFNLVASIPTQSGQRMTYPMKISMKRQ